MRQQEPEQDSQELQQRFLQSVFVVVKEDDGTETRMVIPRDWIFAAVYIEKASLNGPLLKLEVRDMTGTLVDDWQLKYGSLLNAEWGDPQGEQAVIRTPFFVTSATLAGDVVTVIALSDEVRPLKMPAVSTRFYSNKTPDEIIPVVAPGLRRAGDQSKRASTYHLNAGDKPSRLLADMARDKGALCWICRGVIHFSALDALMKQKPAFIYEANNPKAERTISKMRFINQDKAATDAHEYRFVGYSMTDGYIEQGETDRPVRVISDSDMETLRNMQKTLVPKLDIEVEGNPDICPGMVIEVLVYRYDDDNRLDESLPRRLLVKNVAHFEDRAGYTTRIILGEVKG